ncbi:MAG: glycosyltransferase family 2 protein [Burkholderiales bacterium]|nr:glycosyltransferase family 2 protein [Burkholderiales bacterium]
MSLKPLVTVIMPVFNTESYVGEAIESVIAQTYENWELIVVDDGSTDGSRLVVLQFVEACNSRIRLVDHPDGANHGVNASRNRGFEFASGEYIAYLDSDDKFLSDKLEKQIKLASQHPGVSLFLGATRYWHPNDLAYDRVVAVGGPQDQIVLPPRLFEELYPIGSGMAPSVNTILVKRDALIRAGGWDAQFRSYDDQPFLVKFYLAHSIFVSSSVYDNYRQKRSDSIMNTVLTGHGYYYSRLVFLHWLERYLIDNYPDRTNELSLVRESLRDPKLWFLSSPTRYWLSSIWKRARNRIGRLVSI